MDNRKSLVKVTLVFAAVVLLITFFSSSVLYFVSPKVLASRAIMDMDGGAILPLTALLCDDSVFILRTKSGFFGDILILEQRYVTVLWSNETNVSVIGLNHDDLVVTGWDRELRDGQRVMLQV